MKTLISSVFFMVFLAACGPKPLASVKRFLSAEDEAVVELLNDLKKNPNNQELWALLPITYQRAMESRQAMEGYVLRDNPPGDRWVTWRRQLEASQAITDLVMANPKASSMIKNPVYFRDQISEARVKAAEEYYNRAIDLLENNNRNDARRAIDDLNKANRESPGYMDIANQLRIATEMATLYVVVNPVDYYNNRWDFWGFQNDYLQRQMIRDLNNRSYNYTRFMDEMEARSTRREPDRVVDMRFARLMVSNPYTERDNYDRVKEIPNPNYRPGDTIRKNNPVPPTITVRARVVVAKQYINGDADLECRIYDVPTGRNILYDHFPGRYSWVFESASYSGDERALTSEDIRLLNNRFDRYPTREEVGKKLIEDAYGQLLNRIQQGVNFDSY